MNKVPYPPRGGGWFIKSDGEEYQVVKRGRAYTGLGEESNVEKRLNIYHLFFIFMAVGKNIKWGKREADGNYGEENKDLKKLGLGGISSYREL